MLKKGNIIDSVYMVEKVLGSGAQGVIYHVKTQVKRQDLALKLIDISAEEKSRFKDLLDSVKA
ncbi:MAG: hypothetical protein JXN63_02480, partial [Candidatus Delongbacteria bacterium]|nr:hypothetical protein [Candidatus Delongbacteria bacterium]